MRNPQTNILTIEQAVAWVCALRKHQGFVDLVVTNGCFDVLHRGHCELLYTARKRGDALLVLLNSDASIRWLKGEGRPINCQEDRAYALSSLQAVDAVVIFGSLRCDCELRELRPDVYVKGGDYSLAKLDSAERTALEGCKARIEFMPMSQHSTSSLVERIREQRDGLTGGDKCPNY